MTFLLRLLGLDVGSRAHIVNIELLTRGAGTVWVFLLGLILCAGIVYLYRREEASVSPVRRYVMAGLRCAVVVMLLLLLLRPGIRVTVEGDVRRQVILLLDGSQSMSIKDARTDDADIKRAAIASGMIDPDNGFAAPLPAGVASQLSDPPREQLIRSALTGDTLKLLERLEKNYDVKLLTFGRTVQDLGTPDANAPPSPAPGAPPVPVPPPSTLPTPPDPKLTRTELTRAVESFRATLPASALGDAVRETLSHSRGQPVAGIFVATDGANNAGVSPVSAAQSAGGADIPLYLWGLGVTRPKDLAVTQIFAPEIGFVDDEIVTSVRLRTTGLEGQAASLKLKLASKSPGAPATQTTETTVATTDITLGPDGETTLSARFTPKTAGEYTLTAEVPPLPGEVVRDNNSQSARLRIIDGKIKVLYIESQPRWEFKYLQALLLRDRRVDPKFLLLEAAPSVADGDKSPYLARFPTTKEQLFAYDLIILGDLDPRSIATDALNWLADDVTKFGAGLVMIAGRQRSPNLWSGTPLERMLPVEWGPIAPARREAGDSTALKLELTPAGRLSPMLRIADTEAESAALWAKLPDIYWDARVLRARAGADVLLVDAEPAKASRFGKMPVIAVQQSGVGSVLFVGTDNTWRWRRNVGDSIYSRLWGQIVQRLALPHLLGESSRTRLTADRRSYSAGETATLYARLYSATYEPITLPAVRGELRLGDANSAGGPRSSVILRPIPDQPGMYRGEVILPEAGNWLFSVETDDKARLEITAAESRLELSETAMNESLLREMARVSGGAFLREEDLNSLPDQINKKSERVRSTTESELWSSPIYFLLLLALLTTEWILRKGAMLK